MYRMDFFQMSNIVSVMMWGLLYFESNFTKTVAVWLSGGRWKDSHRSGETDHIKTSQILFDC